jgi:hypothetical protein
MASVEADPPPFFAPFPERGIWDRVGLTRGQFLGTLGASIVLFVVVGGPVWRHVHDSHLLRIAVSYGVIPAAVGAALWWNGTPRPALLVGASAVIAAVKLVLTAAFLLAVALVGGR